MAEASVTPDLCVPSRQKRINTDYTEQLGGLCIEASRARRPQRTLLSSLTPHEASDKMRPLVDRRWLSAMAQESNERRSALRSFVVLTFFLLVVYNSNFRWYLSRDSIPARVLPFSLLLDGHLYLDDWVEPYMQGRFAHDPYFVTPVRGHLYSVYPLIEPLTITPLYVLPAWWLRVQHPPFAKGSFALTFLINTMEKLSASLIAALSAGVLYLALRKLVAPRAALAITLVYALASNTWSTSSQSLWRQGFTKHSASQFCYGRSCVIRLPPAMVSGLALPSPWRRPINRRTQSWLYSSLFTSPEAIARTCFSSARRLPPSALSFSFTTFTFSADSWGRTPIRWSPFPKTIP